MLRSVSRGAVALNSTPSVKVKRSPVLAIKEPAMSKLALGPKIIPLGLSKKRLAIPFVCRRPSIFERLAPVTRAKMFSTPATLSKTAEPLVREIAGYISAIYNS